MPPLAVSRILYATGLLLIPHLLPSAYAEEENSADDIGQYRFLFCTDNGILMELSRDYDERVPELKSLGEDETIPWSWVDEPEGGRYTAYLINRKRFESVQLSKLSQFPTGDGGVAGIAGLVDMSPKSVKSCFSYTIKGLICGRPTSAVGKRFIEGKPLSKSLKQMLQAEGGKVNGLCYGASGKKPPIAIIVQKWKDGPAVVRVFAIEGETYSELPFPTNTFRHGKGLLIHDPDADNDVAPWDGELTILPDFDGDGYPEFLVDSTAAMLFSVNINDRKIPTISLRRTLYFGP